MQFTEEQQNAIDLAAKGQSFSLVAPAGSGKSATAVGIGARLKGSKMLYLVYNKSAKLDAEEKFRKAGMSWVDVRTTSSIAWRAYADKRNFESVHGRARAEQIADAYKARMDPKAQAIPARVVAQRMKLKDIDFGDNVFLDAYTQAKLAYDTIERFCNSSRPKITTRDVPLVILGADERAVEAARKHVATLAHKLWLRSIEPDSNLRFTMNYAFKLVSSDPAKDFGYDVVLVDEAQDSNDATMQFLRHQKSAQAILIGDPAQALYAWRGATDQILRFDGPRLHLTQSFRFGEAVAEEARKHLAHTGTGVTIKGLPTIDDRVTEGQMPHPDVVLTRSNAGAMEWAMSYLSVGKRVALVRGKEQIKNLAYAAAALMKGERPNDLELSHFTTWAELVEFSDEPGGGQYKPLVRLVQAYGVGKLIDACEKLKDYTPRYPQHDVAISTCHSIKGLEWHRVQIGDDFREPPPVVMSADGERNELSASVPKADLADKTLEPGVIDRHEAMIHYVAVTRAKRELDRSGLAWIDKYPARELASVTNG
ncbi:UvrD-helicase domain-containing protein [Streptomyces sp. NPDC058947]|uniref:UvrD-helicase domain-containing protein n=1 Tax=Streptomyces sp. NPDC058947 TaxID=3346675 RepID=UPI0036875484